MEVVVAAGLEVVVEAGLEVVVEAGFVVTWGFAVVPLEPVLTELRLLVPCEDK